MASAPPTDTHIRAEMEAVYALYARLAPDLHPDTGLGGKLLYAGELDTDGSRLVRAANIAGAASVAAAPEEPIQRAAIRNGVVDFLVTSLDESLRILKNEIRKHNAVSVAVAISPTLLMDEMRDRGVLPDVLRHSPIDESAAFVREGAQLFDPQSSPRPQELMTFASVTPELEQRILQLIPEWDHAARRWFRLSHRYLGSQARRVRSVPATPAIAAALAAVSPLTPDP